MRSPFAYVPRNRPLQAASVAPAVAYLAALLLAVFLFSNPLVPAAVVVAAVTAGYLAGAGRAMRAALRMGFALFFLIVVVNMLVVDRGETVLARLGDWPLLGQVNVTLEATVAGCVYGLRALAAIVVFAVYSACVDPDRVLRALRPIAGRSALTATLVSRLVPVAAADAGRLRDAAALRGPGAAAVGRAAMARRLLAGSLDRSVDVAATLELRGYSLDAPRARARRARSRYDRRFFLAAAVLAATAIACRALGADEFQTYPRLASGFGPATAALIAVLLASGLVPLRRRVPGRRRTAARTGARGRDARPALEAGRV